MSLLKKSALFIIISNFMSINAQVVSELKPSIDGKMGEFTEWKTSSVNFDDGTSATFDYRIALADRKGIGCHYELEVKNTSALKLEFKMKSSYFDKLVKSQFGDEIKETLKPEKSVLAKFIAQGCKKEKGVEKDDYGHCMACDFGINIYVTKK
ncbi:hypothetical protein ACSVH2_05930 [Flavobacterium sp. RSB2_4_14]|uniref:hypothetical protein n=1 Tax=Flavobacterium sp. RSB2_4_14 TaxID=3447665 RepID=UPI003F30351F